MYTLHDTFNNVEISNHKTLYNAVKAKDRHLSAVRKHNGSNSYLTYAILKNGEEVDPDEIYEAQQQLFA